MNDQQLLQLLKDALDATETVPAEAVDAAYAAIDMSTLSEELAVLAFDSSLGTLVDMRATEAEVRLLSFVNDHLTIDLELHGDGHTIVGQLSPPSDVVLHVEAEDGTVVEAPTDEFGRFRVSAPSGPIRFRARGLLVTPWITR